MIPDKTSRGNLMKSKEFIQSRHYLGKSQKQLAQLLSVSLKAVQSFEQGWRNIPAYAERQLLVLLALRKAADPVKRPCWEIKNCPVEWRENCTEKSFCGSKSISKNQNFKYVT